MSIEINPHEVVRAIFSSEELQQALTIIEACREKKEQPNHKLKKMFITPRLDEIMRRVGHQCDATYMAYLVEYYFLEDVE